MIGTGIGFNKWNYRNGFLEEFKAHAKNQMGLDIEIREYGGNTGICEIMAPAPLTDVQSGWFNGFVDASEYLELEA